MVTEQSQQGIRETGKPGELIINGKKHKALIYPLEGRTIELYRVGALADALEKTSQLIIKWEKDKLFPKPLYRMQGSGFGNCKRWYSKEQIVNLRKVWMLFPLRKGAGRHKNNFFKTVHRVFYKTNIVTLDLASKVEKDGGQSEKQNPDLQRSTG